MVPARRPCAAAFSLARCTASLQVAQAGCPPTWKYCVRRGVPHMAHASPASVPALGPSWTARSNCRLSWAAGRVESEDIVILGWDEEKGGLYGDLQRGRSRMDWRFGRYPA